VPTVGVVPANIALDRVAGSFAGVEFEVPELLDLGVAKKLSAPALYHQSPLRLRLQTMTAAYSA
jgi:hypothetical protein